MAGSDRRGALVKLLGAGAVLAPGVRALAQAQATQQAGAGEALQLNDFEALAKAVLPPAHWGYMASGGDDDLTLRANVQAFGHIGLRPMRLVDVSRPSTAVEVLGEAWESPIFLCPVGSQRAFHPEGEMATARAAKSRRTRMMLSNVSTYSIEEVSKAIGAPPWQQLYMPLEWSNTVRMVKRIEDSGCKVLVWTVDLLAGRNTPTMTRFARQDTRDCAACHTGGPGVAIHRPMYDGMPAAYNPRDATWETFEKLKALTKMKVLVKGIDTAEDAALALRHGADGIVVSNHGGRAVDTLRATIDCLPEVVQAVKGRIPVFMDGGVRHGSDVYKALALGATAVGIGRPYIWGLSSNGQAGVERVIDILRAELTLTLQQMGTPTIRDITSARVMRV